MVQKKKAGFTKPPGGPFGGPKEESKMETRITKPQPGKSKMAAGSTVPHPGGPFGGPIDRITGGPFGGPLDGPFGGPLWWST